MSAGPPDSREFGKYFAFAQVGLEMVAPIVVGVVVDNYFDCAPFGVAVGAVLGLVVGLWHLVVLARRFDESDASRPRRNKM
jgi:F0F1-type ATP synthase assembly protein I